VLSQNSAIEKLTVVNSMKQPEIPANESDRQAALDRYKILDTLPEIGRAHV
jgi:hypothetical protein